ncbi:hypothetical protein CHS0354_042572 [Potamilus streckersoni]|uniref:Uncharacterized protein n=1 Tax=Potamilus streckersoni TaxID=2493646 RepID=A0AAE0TES7_9BIVA|nr:hypothetical protein CHS0354_042572 [Potamilus streckersoni]
MAHRTLHTTPFPFILMLYILSINAETSDNAKSLYTKLFTTDAYNKHVRPIQDQTQAIDIDIDYHLSGILDFDEQGEKLTTSGYFSISWNDYYLQWNPSSYGGLDFLFVPQDNIWKPDIALKNSVSEFKGLGSTFLYVQIDPSGRVKWYPYMILQSTCSVDITYIPFDTQSCSLKFVAWSYTKNEVLLTEGTSGIILNEYEENSEWKIVSSSVDTLTESYEATVIFQITLKRKPLFYVLNIIVPVIMLSILNACIFVLPAESGEKASFSITAFLSMAVFLTIVASTLPQNSDSVSYLGIYLELMAGISTLIVIITLFELRFYFRDATVDPIPKWLIRFQVIVQVIRCSRRSQVNPIENQVNPIKNQVNPIENDQNDDGKSDVTWKNVCNAIDFVLFWIFLLLIFITTLSIYIISSSF